MRFHKRGWIFMGLMGLLSVFASAATVQQTLYLNRGDFVTVDTTSFPALAFNSTPTFAPQNTVIHLVPGDSLSLMLINTDSVTHSFQVAGQPGLPLVIASGDTAWTDYFFPNRGVYIYQDKENAPAYSYLGAAGMVVVDSPADGEFYWNIREHESAKNIAAGASQPVNWAQYKPDYFTINGWSKPDLMMDSTARVRGNVGDTLRIYVANTGLSKHSMHFHGYHLRIVWSSKGNRKVNWSKDTIPLDSYESAIWELVPDKPGEYPVHDHNLIAITGGNQYPNGMFLTMLIQ